MTQFTSEVTNELAKPKFNERSSDAIYKCHPVVRWTHEYEFWRKVKVQTYVTLSRFQSIIDSKRCKIHRQTIFHYVQNHFKRQYFFHFISTISKRFLNESFSRSRLVRNLMITQALPIFSFENIMRSLRISSSFVYPSDEITKQTQQRTRRARENDISSFRVHNK